MTELPSFTDFARQLNTLFCTQTAHGLIELKLIEAKELPEGSHSTQFKNPISLIFINNSQPDMVLSQGTYRLEHPALGVLSLFVTPVLSGRPAPDYQVLIN